MNDQAAAHGSSRRVLVADVYARMLPEWPALVETVGRDAKAIEAMFYARRGIG